MPQVYQPVEKSKVIAILAKRGYGIDSCPGYEFRLATPTGKKRNDGSLRMQPIGGIRRDDWRRISKYSKDEEDAADQAEAICTGKALTGSTAALAEPQSAGPDLETLGKLVDNRVAGIAAKVEANDQKLDRLSSLLERLLLREATAETPATLPPPDAAVPEQPTVVMGYEPEKKPHPSKGKTRVKVDGKWRWVPKTAEVAS